MPQIQGLGRWRLEEIPVRIHGKGKIEALHRAPDRRAVDVHENGRPSAREHLRRIGLHAFDVLRADRARVDGSEHAIERNHPFGFGHRLLDGVDDLEGPLTGERRKLGLGHAEVREAHQTVFDGHARVRLDLHRSDGWSRRAALLVGHRRPRDHVPLIGTPGGDLRLVHRGDALGRRVVSRPPAIGQVCCRGCRSRLAPGRGVVAGVAGFAVVGAGLAVAGACPISACGAVRAHAQTTASRADRNEARVSIIGASRRIGFCTSSGMPDGPRRVWRPCSPGRQIDEWTPRHVTILPHVRAESALRQLCGMASVQATHFCRGWVEREFSIGNRADATGDGAGGEASRPVQPVRRRNLGNGRGPNIS